MGIIETLSPVLLPLLLVCLGFLIGSMFAAYEVMRSVSIPPHPHPPPASSTTSSPAPPSLADRVGSRSGSVPNAQRGGGRVIRQVQSSTGPHRASHLMSPLLPTQPGRAASVKGAASSSLTVDNSSTSLAAANASSSTSAAQSSNVHGSSGDSTRRS
eukprot:5148445-Ditylum_brightwellii.AAC.1